MAVQKSKVSRSKTKMRSASKFMAEPVVRVDSTTGVTHVNHQLAGDYYRGKRVYRNFKAIEQSQKIESNKTDS